MHEFYKSFPISILRTEFNMDIFRKKRNKRTILFTINIECFLSVIDISTNRYSFQKIATLTWFIIRICSSSEWIFVEILFSRNKRLGSFWRNETIRDRAFTETEIWKSMFYDVWMKIWEKLKPHFSFFVWLNFQSIETFSYVEIIYLFYSLYIQRFDSFFNFSSNKYETNNECIKHRVWNWKLNIFIRMCCFITYSQNFEIMLFSFFFYIYTSSHNTTRFFPLLFYSSCQVSRNISSYIMILTI